ncbi:twin-arginine translocase TatA/TatE family subunit [Patulibacter sp. SYSU D01012]|uniref:Sec-independent protein translocase subunit TatA/TatB n=1 Tax=Patulibacter sp. SYSU D01012 TaxID=2817381 RepID=UPI001B3087B7|nr:twin-arginine translocase TatA/TatE family subunit [Patulibacter sp. SYSU D01012]
MGPIGPMELIVILVIALLVLGPKKLPEVGKSLGKGMREFKDSISSANPFDEDDEDERPARKRPAQVHAAPSEPVAPAATTTAATPAEGNREAQDAFGRSDA